MIFKENEVFAGRYRLISKIGVGGFSEVWKVADQMANDAIVALKVYAPEKGLDEFGLKQFRREYSVVLNLNHQNLLTARYFDIHEGHPYLIMPFCEGGSVYGRIIEKGNYTEEELAEFLVQIAPALANLHENEIVHQDIKPDNILLDGKGNYLLMDFGISGKLRCTLRKSTTAAGSMTVAYAPPEKFKGMGVMSPESDVFSLGVMMIEMLTGDLPWNGMGGAYLKSDDDLPELPEKYSRELRQLVHDCLLVIPEARCDLAQVFAAAINYLKSGSWSVESVVKEKPISKPISGRETVKMDGANLVQNGINRKTEGKFKEDEKKKSFGLLIVIITVAAISVLFIVLKPWKGSGSKIDPAEEKLFITLKNKADSFTENQENWEKALEKYEAAFAIIADSVVKDSIGRIKTRLKKFGEISENKLAAEKAKNEEDLAKATELAALEKKRKLSNVVRPPSNQTVQVNGETFEIIGVEGGTFIMGGTEEQHRSYDNEWPIHKVTLDNYGIGKYEVTQAQWRAIMGSSSDPTYFKECSNCPVEQVSWNDVQEFLRKLNTLTGKQFRLPTEAEWEFAARGGVKSKGSQYSGNTDINAVGWHEENSIGATHEVGKKEANELGLYDMSGNVWEWCNDWFAYYPKSNQINPIGPSNGSSKVIRGGSWTGGEDAEVSGHDCRVAMRRAKGPNENSNNIGFRLAL